WFFSPRLYDLALVWLVVALVLLAMRAPLTVALGREAVRRTGLPAFDRTVMRLLGASVAWAAVATLWHIVVNVHHAREGFAAARVFSGGAFALCRNWIGLLSRPSATAGPLDRLKPYVPEILAYLTVVLAAIAVGAMLRVACGTDWLRWWAACALMCLAVVGVLF